MFLAAAASSTHTYRGNSEINFFADDQNGLFVTIDTDRLHIRSVEATNEEYNRYAALFGNKDVMEKFATGQTKTREEMRRRINDVWVKRWREHDPYSGLTVLKKGTKDFLGHIVLGHGDHPGEAELAGLGNQSFWEQGYGREAATAIVQEYAPATVKEGYLLEGKPLERIVATARPDNPASGRILEKVGMQFVRAEEKYGAMRHHYSMNLNAIQAPSSWGVKNSGSPPLVTEAGFAGTLSPKSGSETGTFSQGKTPGNSDIFDTPPSSKKASNSWWCTIL